MHAGDAPLQVAVSIKGLKELILLTEGDINDDNNHADWANAKITWHSKEFNDVRPNTIPAYQEQAIILTPKPGPTPRITGKKVFGARPGHPFLFTVSATGDRPMTFTADDLPDGLQLDPQTGRIGGSLKQLGEYQVTLHAKNAWGETARPLKIVCGWQLGLVPAMGWNSWNCFADKITKEKIKTQAAALVSSGLADHGWNYVVTDEGWSTHPGSQNPLLTSPDRDAQGQILPNRNFPDMKGLADYIHSLGPRAGSYTSPGPCAAAITPAVTRTSSWTRSVSRNGDLIISNMTCVPITRFSPCAPSRIKAMD